MMGSKLSPKQRRWKEAWEGKRYPWCTCDLKDKSTDCCTRIMARCQSRANFFAKNWPVTMMLLAEKYDA